MEKARSPKVGTTAFGVVSGSEPQRPVSGKTAERRLRFPAEVATKLDIAASMRGQTPSEFVAFVLRPHLDFELPKVPTVLLKQTFDPQA